MKLLSEIQVSLYLTQTLPYANLNLHIRNASVIFFLSPSQKAEICDLLSEVGTFW